jgi:hypothetical protein
MLTFYMFNRTHTAKTVDGFDFSVVYPEWDAMEQAFVKHLQRVFSK